MLEPKSDIRIKLGLCQRAIQCTEPVPCMFAQSRCLQLSGIDILPMKTRQELAGCKIESLKCLLQVKTLTAQDQCIKEFRSCGTMLGVDIYESSIVNFIDHENRVHGKEKLEEENVTIYNNSSPVLLEEILQNIRSNLNKELGDQYDIKLISLKDENFPKKNDSTLQLVLKHDEKSPDATKTISTNTKPASIKGVLNHLDAKQNDHDDIHVTNEISSDDIVNVVKAKLNTTNNESLSIVLGQNSSKSFTMELPTFGISISVKDDTKSAEHDEQIRDDTTFGMSMPVFGFNITVNKDPSQCLQGTIVYDDFAKIPNDDPCQLCTCNTGKIQCFTRECVTPTDTSKCQKLPIPKGSCCPKYLCEESEYDNTPLGREDISKFNVEDTLDMLGKVKDSLLNILNNATDEFQDIEGELTKKVMKTSLIESHDISVSTVLPKVIPGSVTENLDKSIEEGSGIYPTEGGPPNQLDNPDLSSNFLESQPSESTISDMHPVVSTSVGNKILSSSNGSNAKGNTVISSEGTGATHVTSDAISNSYDDSQVFFSEDENYNRIEANTLISSPEYVNSKAKAQPNNKKPKDPSTTLSYPNDIEEHDNEATDFGINYSEATESEYDDKNEDRNETHFSEPSSSLVELSEAKPTDNKRDSMTKVAGQSTTITSHSDNLQQDILTNESEEGQMDNGDWQKSVIGNKDVKVFLNFTWLDGSFQLEEDFSNPEYSKNLSSKIMQVLNAGVGYVIVPEGEKPEKQDEKTVHLIQTVKLDHTGNIEIDTTISNSSKILYSDFDKQFIEKVEEKTRKITEDIFDQMQSDLAVTSTESLISTNTNLNDAGTTQLPFIDPVILIALETDGKIKKAQFDIYILRAIQQATNTKVVIVQPNEFSNINEIISNYADSFLVQGQVNNLEDFDFNVYHNRDKLDNASNFSEKEKS